MDGSKSDENWRERAEQLQHALSSRISVEQAKGILGERLGLDMDGAFAVLRYAARGERMKIQELAQAVVDSEETPEPVIRAIARHATTLVNASRKDRIVRAEMFFRAVNEEIAFNDGHGETVFLCECGNPLCTEGLTLTSAALAELHAAPDLFVVLPGHEIPDVEDVVDHSNGYLIVRKNAPKD